MKTPPFNSLEHDESIHCIFKSGILRNITVLWVAVSPDAFYIVYTTKVTVMDSENRLVAAMV